MEGMTGRWSYRELPDGRYEIIVTATGKVLAVVNNQPDAFRIVAQANTRIHTLH
jgi:hypothetical protein